MMLGDVEMIDGIVLTTLGSVSRIDAIVDKTDAFVQIIEGESTGPFCCPMTRFRSSRVKSWCGGGVQGRSSPSRLRP